MPVTLDDLAQELGGELVQPARGPLRRLGLTLDVDDDVVAWAREADLDALWVHRGRDVPLAALGELGVLGEHDAFDAAIPGLLAGAAGLRNTSALLDDPRALVGECPSDLLERVRKLLGGEEEHHPGLGEPLYVGVVAGAMTDSLVRAADEAGAGLYVTGQWRAPAADAVAETGIEVLVCGHERLERWALGRLAEQLQHEHPDLECVLAPPPEPRRRRVVAR